MPVIDWALLTIFLIVATLAGILIYHVTAGFYHYRYYVKRRHEPGTWKCQPRRFLTPKQLRRAALTGTGNLTLAGLVTGCLAYGIATEQLYSRVYIDVSEYGWLYTIGMTPVLFVMMDCINFSVHRLLHSRLLYRRIHRIHHSYVATSPYVATAMHPLELLMQQAASFLPIFFIPFHWTSVAAVLFYILVFNIIDHSGVRLVSVLPWQPPSTYHDDHHAHFHVNYGQHLMIWDRLGGTLRRHGRRYGENVYGGRGESAAGATGVRDKFFDY